MPDIWDFDVTDANNIGRWPENMQFRNVNNAGRADEGILARWYKDTNCSLTASGSSNAYSVTANRTVSALTDNLIMGFTANHTNTGASTLNVSGQGAVAIKRLDGSDLLANDILNGQKVLVIYKSATTSWQMLTPPANDVAYSLTNTQTIAAAALLQVLNRTENDTTEREVASYRSGSGAGSKGSLRLVGGGANDVAELRWYVGATELLRLTAALLTLQQDTKIGASLHLDSDGFVDLTEVAVPAAPAANVARLYCRDNAGLSQLYAKDSAGTESLLSAFPAADQTEMEAASAVNRTVTPGRQHFHPSAAKAWLHWTDVAGTPTIGVSSNVSSLTDNGVGDQTINMTTAFSSANYAPASIVQRPSGGPNGFLNVKQGVSPTSSALRTQAATDAQAAMDATYAGVAMFGDFA